MCKKWAGFLPALSSYSCVSSLHPIGNWFCFMGAERMIAMRDFLWNYFSLTGAIDAYLLYKEHEALVNSSDQETQAVIAQEEADSVP